MPNINPESFHLGNCLFYSSYHSPATTISSVPGKAAPPYYLSCTDSQAAEVLTPIVMSKVLVLSIGLLKALVSQL